MSDLKTILVVDDNEMDVLIARKNLEMSGKFSQIFTATDGEKGLQALEENNPDYILLDINMPILDGWGFLDSFGLDFLDDLSKPKTKVIMLSSSIDEEDSKRALQNPAVSQYLVKPLNAMKIQQFLEYSVAS